MSLLTLAQAKQQLRITDALHDADVQAKLDAAEGVIFEYVGPYVGDAWTAETLPKSVETAILRYLAHLNEDRTGRASDGDKPASADVWDDIRQILGRVRTPVFGRDVAV
jgi:Phage gp6-like head-tail connector protein